MNIGLLKNLNPSNASFDQQVQRRFKALKTLFKTCLKAIYFKNQRRLLGESGRWLISIFL